MAAKGRQDVFWKAYQFPKEKDIVGVTFTGAADIVSREAAAKILAADGRYLIDETTASVRFIVPIQASEADGHDVDARACRQLC